MAAPTDQRAGVKPIAFALDYNGQISAPITLQIRPQDMTRTETSRTTVHQTLGRGPNGWADNFGPGMPSVTISGHTGWRTAAGSGMDGVQAFEALNNLVHHGYNDAKQLAVNSGIDPALVKLIFVDTLDGFAWSVAPMQFQLRRSKSSPLLLQYNIVMQAVSTAIDSVPVRMPETGNPSNGLLALSRTITRLERYANNLRREWAIYGEPDEGGGGLLSGTVLGDLIDVVNDAAQAVVDAVDGVADLSSSIAGQLIGFASDLAAVGLNVFRAAQAVYNLPSQIQQQVMSVAAAFNELVCIFANSLRPRPVYQQYNGLYGASNCSSTVGGRPYSPYENLNVFQLITESNGSVSLSSEAMASVTALRTMDPVLAPMPAAELERHIAVIMRETA